ncbi:hypothetical protein MsAg5_15350 [Methanosarcinaceae archaeon Ag5]|uniref:VOC domain-containing protein n=1 Tax=Methanolapillus africanus TaxID=3028297 RepID=A0AAE4SDJ3_9EURY|nr:hypothetical protein [Methanosarcinaceae archaeon Ag5]
MIGVEVDMIVSDSLKALALYESVFEVERIEVTDYKTGMNEAVFSMYGTRFHLLDENPDFQMNAPKPGDPKPMWMNVVVPNIRETYDKALKAGCDIVQPINEMPEMGVINAFFADPFGYLWLLHEIVREVRFEERMKIMEKNMGM